MRPRQLALVSCVLILSLVAVVEGQRKPPRDPGQPNPSPRPPGAAPNDPGVPRNPNGGPRDPNANIPRDPNADIPRDPNNPRRPNGDRGRFDRLGPDDTVNFDNLANYFLFKPAPGIDDPPPPTREQRIQELLEELDKRLNPLIRQTLKDSAQVDTDALKEPTGPKPGNAEVTGLDALRKLKKKLAKPSTPRVAPRTASETGDSDDELGDLPVDQLEQIWSLLSDADALTGRNGNQADASIPTETLSLNFDQITWKYWPIGPIPGGSADALTGRNGNQADGSIPTETLSLNFDQITWRYGPSAIPSGSADALTGRNGNQVDGSIPTETLSLNFDQLTWRYWPIPDGSADGSIPSETLSLNFDKIEWKYWPPSGSADGRRGASAPTSRNMLQTTRESAPHGPMVLKGKRILQNDETDLNFRQRANTPFENGSATDIKLRTRPSRSGDYLKYKLDRAFIKSWSTSGDADDRPTENVAFYYNKIAFAYPSTTDGKPFLNASIAGISPQTNGSFFEGRMLTSEDLQRESQIDQPFLLPVEDVFTIQGRGTTTTASEHKPFFNNYRPQFYFPASNVSKNEFGMESLEIAHEGIVLPGPSNGSWVIPEIDDEILVGFEHGAPRSLPSSHFNPQEILLTKTNHANASASQLSRPKYEDIKVQLSPSMNNRFATPLRTQGSRVAKIDAFNWKQTGLDDGTVARTNSPLYFNVHTPASAGDTVRTFNLIDTFPTSFPVSDSTAAPNPSSLHSAIEESSIREGGINSWTHKLPSRGGDSQQFDGKYFVTRTTHQTGQSSAAIPGYLEYPSLQVHLPQASGVEYPNLKITFSAADGTDNTATKDRKQMLTWYQDMIQKGKGDSTDKRKQSLYFPEQMLKSIQHEAVARPRKQMLTWYQDMQQKGQDAESSLSSTVMPGHGDSGVSTPNQTHLEFLRLRAKRVGYSPSGTGKGDLKTNVTTTSPKSALSPFDRLRIQLGGTAADGTPIRAKNSMSLKN